MRLLKALQVLMAMHPEAVALTLQNEKAIVENTGYCPDCRINIAIYNKKAYCWRCAMTWTEKQLVLVRTDYISPITREMVECKAALARSMEYVTTAVRKELLENGKGKDLPRVQEEAPKEKKRH